MEPGGKLLAIVGGLRYGDRVKTCAQCGAEVTGRFCSACGAATSEPVTVPAWAPTPAPTAPTSTPTALATQPTSEARLSTTLPAQTSLRWHRNGYLALGLGVAALGSTILWLVGLPLPPVGGLGALVVGIIGFRARNTSTSSTGWWGAACAAVALMLTVVGIVGSTPGATPAAPDTTVGTYSSEYFVLVSTDPASVCYKGNCPMSGTFRNDGGESGSPEFAYFNFNVTTPAGLITTIAACHVQIPIVPTGLTSTAACNDRGPLDGKIEPGDSISVVALISL